VQIICGDVLVIRALYIINTPGKWISYWRVYCGVRGDVLVM
jgi:hypothetical protein